MPRLPNCPPHAYHRHSMWAHPQGSRMKQTVVVTTNCGAILPAVRENQTKKNLPGFAILKDMRRIASQGIANWQTRNGAIRIEDHYSKEENWESVGDVSKVCSHIFFRCSYSARIGRLDILWSVNKLAPAVTVWNKACDKRLPRSMSHIRYTGNDRQYVV